MPDLERLTEALNVILRKNHLDEAEILQQDGIPYISCSDWGVSFVVQSAVTGCRITARFWTGNTNDLGVFDDNELVVMAAMLNAVIDEHIVDNPRP